MCFSLCQCQVWGPLGLQLDASGNSETQQVEDRNLPVDHKVEKRNKNNNNREN